MGSMHFFSDSTATNAGAAVCQFLRQKTCGSKSVKKSNSLGFKHTVDGSEIRQKPVDMVVHPIISDGF